MTVLPTLKFKSLTNFPANVVDGVGIDAVKENGVYSFNIDYSDFAPPIAVLPDPPNQNVLLWDSATGTYSLVPIAIVATGGAVPEAPADGVVYGRKSATWVNAWLSPVFTGNPTAPTPAPGDSTVSVATTAFVTAAVGAIPPSNAAPTMAGVAAPGISVTYARGDHVHPTDTSRAPLASPVFTGDPHAPTAAPGDNDSSIATTAFVTNAVAGIAPSGSVPLMDGLGTSGVAVTYARGDHIHPTDTSRAPLLSPVFLGNPTAPTPAPGDHSLSIATTAFVSGGFIGEAPNDGTQYARQNLGWSPIAGGGGGGGTGNVTGPVGATTDHIATYNGTTGQVIKDGGFKISDLQVAPAALTRVNDSNVTLTLGGLPNVALLQATSITVGWNGTLAASRGGFGADVSAQSGVPVFAAGVPTFTASSGTGNFARVNNPVFTGDPQAPTPAPGDNDTSIATTAFVQNAVTGGAVLRSYLAGLTLSAGTVSFTVQPGIAADSTNAGMMALAASLTKTMAAWAVGGAGSLDTGAIAANACYHVFLIKRLDTGIVDLLISLSPTAPTMPSPYTLFRRIGSLLTTASSQWTAFVQYGDEFLWTTTNGDVAVSNLGTAAILYALTVPTGVSGIRARTRGNMSSATAGTNCLVNSPDEAATAPGTPSGNVSSINTSAGNGGGGQYSHDIRVNTSGQVRAVASNASTTFRLVTYGYYDDRGKSL